jgi:hypothetical protein
LRIRGKKVREVIFPFLAMDNVAHKGSCGQSSERQKNIIRGETKRKKINLPFLGECL